MQSIKPFALLLSLVLLLSGCSGSESSDSLKITRIYTDIVHYHPSFLDKWNVTPNRSISFTVSVRIKDPKGVDNLTEVYFRDKANNTYFAMLGGPNNFSKDVCYYTTLDIFECNFYSNISLDRINLSNWEIIVENKQGKTSNKDFEFLLPGGENVDEEQFVYSSIYSDSTNYGIPAIEAMTISNNDLVFTSNPDSQSFHIEFTTTDTRATYYALAFYDATSAINYIGYASLSSPSIVSTPITQGLTTSLNIPYSEISLKNNTTIDDINGLHIKLYDTPISWLYDGFWFNYVSFSEFITLSP